MRLTRILGLAALLAVTPVLAQTAAPDSATTQSRPAKLSYAAKMAKAESDLDLTPVQKPLWDAYVAERNSSYAARKNKPPLDLPSWLDEEQKQYAGEAQALAPLWASLTIDQRQIADKDLMPHRRGKRAKNADDTNTAEPAPQ